MSVGSCRSTAGSSAAGSRLGASFAGFSSRLMRAMARMMGTRMATTSAATSAHTRICAAAPKNPGTESPCGRFHDHRGGDGGVGGVVAFAHAAENPSQSGIAEACSHRSRASDESGVRGSRQNG